MRIAGSLGLALLILPTPVQAAVLINEIAWMGTTANANAEWIELMNDGSSSVDLSGWTLVSSSGSPSITLAGSIAPGGYFLLERSSDSSVPSVTADHIYTGALTNSGATLTLSDLNGGVIDSVVGGTNWADIGGDNVTKDTAQRVGSTWHTATPTPRAINAGVSASGSDSGNLSSTSTNPGAGSGSMAYSPQPSSIGLEIGPHMTVFAHVPIRLSAQVKNKSGEIDVVARVRWSLGDGSSAEGNTIQKTYDYVGTYLVTAEAAEGSFSARDELTMTVLVPSVEIVAVSSEGVIIRNNARSRLDLSGWRLSDSSSSFQMPDGTIILPATQVFFPAAVTKIGGGREATLAYPNGVIATRYTMEQASLPLQPGAVTGGSNEVQDVEPVAPRITVSVSPAHETEIISAPRAESDSLSARGATVPAEEGTPLSGSFSAMLHSPWTLGFFGVLAAAGAALMVL